MTTETIIFILVCAVILAAFMWFLFDREIRNSVVMQDFRADFAELQKRIEIVMPHTAEQMIDRFEDKWSRYIDRWTLANYTSKLYAQIFEKNGNKSLN